MFNKKEREILGQLSLQLFGTSSKWQKLIRTPHFRVTESVEDFKLTHVKDGPRIVRLDTAQNLGLIKNGQEIPEVPRTISREPTFNELHEMLSSRLIEMKLALMSDDEQIDVLSYLFSKKRQPRNPLLAVQDPQDPEFRKTIDGLCALMPPEYGDYIKRVTGSLSVHGFDAVKFCDRLLYVFQFEADAELKCASVLAGVNVRERMGAFQRQNVRLEKLEFVKVHTGDATANDAFVAGALT